MRYDQDRVAGALVGLAAGDALGAGYEFTRPAPDASITMRGGGGPGWAPGEWTDDTQMAVCIAQVTADGGVDLERIGEAFLGWYGAGQKDVGIQTGGVLGAARDGADVPVAAAAYFARNPGRSAGNGSLMRTAPVALAHLGDDAAIRDAAMAVSALTHGDPLAGEACVLWCLAIDRAVREGRLDGVRDGLDLLAEDRRGFWAERIAEAEAQPPVTFRSNGYVVTALQAAWSAIWHTREPEGAEHVERALVEAVRIGDDTDTVAAIAGQLLGARYGVSAISWRWKRILHGWPGLRTDDLIRLAVATAQGGADLARWPEVPSLVPEARRSEGDGLCKPVPEDPDLLVGNLPGLRLALERDVDAVVSLCRVGRDDVPPDVEHVQVWVTDKDGASDNPNLGFVLGDTVDAVRTLRGEGKRVYLHCHGGRRRTSAIAALYLAERLGISGGDAHERLRRGPLPEASLNPAFAPFVEGVPARVGDHGAADGRPPV